MGEAPEAVNSHVFEFSHLYLPQSNQLWTLIVEFGDALTTELGQCMIEEYQIELTDPTPVRRPPYRLSPPKVHVLREKIQAMLLQGKTRLSISNNSSPIFFSPQSQW